MKIGVGIDTGGTCTDAVIYQMEDRQILASAKANTTKEDLSVGITNALLALPQDLVKQAEVIALSTTLATNACVEHKGGRGGLVFFGVNPENVKRSGREYGLTAEDRLVFIDSKTKPSGEIVREPDWEAFEAVIEEKLSDCDAVGVVEMFAVKSGAKLEKEARERIQRKLHIPVVCGYTLFSENNIVKRGAGVLLNARLISIIEGFTEAVKASLSKMEIDAPFVIVRSDGSMMAEAFAKEHPVETLLCGPVASVMGAMELTGEQSAVVVDMGGTTTDVALVKKGMPKIAEKGVAIGGVSTFVKGLDVDTFGLGGDSGVGIDEERKLFLEAEKVMPISMAAAAYPQIKETLQKQAENPSMIFSQREEIYLGVKNIEDSLRYTAEEKELAMQLYRNPMSLEEAGKSLSKTVYGRQIKRLTAEGILIRCAVTPTDAMHVLGDFSRFDAEAAYLAARRIGNMTEKTEKEVCQEIYRAVEKKLYCNLVRILLKDSFLSCQSDDMINQLEPFIAECYEKQVAQEPDFVSANFGANATLIGVGAPTHVFLERVGNLLSAKVALPAHGEVANALGAVVGNISAKVVVEIRLNQEDGSYTVFGRGHRYIETNLDAAKERGRQLAMDLAGDEARQRGAKGISDLQISEEDNTVKTDFGELFMGYKITAEAKGVF